jgi:hypothetical protein
VATPNRFTDFREQIATNAGAPATSNLYQIILPLPAVFSDNTQNGTVNKQIRNRAVNTVRNINYYASNVTVPSRAITTGEVNNFGMMRRFVTGQTNSEITISFLVTKDMQHRQFFEQWMNAAASDSDNTVGFYDNYVTDMMIIKWEHGANFKIKPKGYPKSTGLHPSQASAVWKMYGAFPTNISTMSFDNEQTSLLQMDIQFYFERYRFDQVSPATLKTKDGKRQVINYDEIQLRVSGSGNPDVQRFSIG